MRVNMKEWYIHKLSLLQSRKANATLLTLVWGSSLMDLNWNSDIELSLYKHRLDDTCITIKQLIDLNYIFWKLDWNSD